MVRQQEAVRFEFAPRNLILKANNHPFLDKLLRLTTTGYEVKLNVEELCQCVESAVKGINSHRPKLNFEIMDETLLLMHWAQSPDENTPSREREVTVHATGTGSFAVSARWLAKFLRLVTGEVTIKAVGQRQKLLATKFSGSNGGLQMSLIMPPFPDGGGQPVKSDSPDGEARTTATAKE